jgi:hypothetical protein
MTFMSASTLAPHHLQHKGRIEPYGHSGEDDQHDPVSSPYIWVKVWHVDNR